MSELKKCDCGNMHCIQIVTGIKKECCFCEIDYNHTDKTDLCKICSFESQCDNLNLLPAGEYKIISIRNQFCFLKNNRILRPNFYSKKLDDISEKKLIEIFQ